jgi:epoxyqueuosine reductase
LTIEYKGQISTDLAERTGDRLFGCDECVLACPYQEDAPVCKNKQLKFYSDRARLDLGRILNLTEAGFDAEFADSPIKRSGLESLKRNAKICLANATSREI